MCTLLLLSNVLQDYPIIALHNRYVLRNANIIEYPPYAIRYRYKVFCPLDLKINGSWVGFNEKGLFMAVTDQHSCGNYVGNSVRSRGILLLETLGSFEDVEEAKNYIVSELKKNIYRCGNFVIVDSGTIFHVVYEGSNRIYINMIKDKVYAVTNLMLTSGTILDDKSQKIFEIAEKRRLRALELGKEIATAVEEGRAKSIDEVLLELAKVAKDHRYGRSRESICMHDDVWMTSSSTMVAVGRDIVKSRILYAYGNPCENNFIDYSHVVRTENELSLISTKLLGKKVAICVTGGVAAIEAPKLARELRRYGAEVRAYMTNNAVRYGISPLVMEWATKNRVILELTGQAEHIADFDIAVVYPATLNTISKFALGIADNAVTTLLASLPPNRVVLAPAMNLKLYSNPILRENLNKLKSLGVTVVEPRIDEGSAKVANIEEVVDYVIRVLSTSRLKNRRVLVLTGSSRYRIDAVRYISSRATGVLGYWIAKELFYRGCDVKVISGPSQILLPRYIPVTYVETTEQFLEEALKELRSSRYDVVISPAALLDFKPVKQIDEKIPSTVGKLVIELTTTPKVLAEIRKAFPDVEIVAFKLEYRVDKETLIRKAQQLLKELNTLMVVANDSSKILAKEQEVVIVDRKDRVTEFKGLKKDVATKIVDLMEELL